MLGAVAIVRLGHLPQQLRHHCLQLLVALLRGMVQAAHSLQLHHGQLWGKLLGTIEA
jgi:hypothetical protein